MSEELVRIISDEIASSPDRAIPFRRYMELCLYHPRWGYYRREGTKIGKEGDFYTSSHVGDLFGRVMSDVLEEMRRFFLPHPHWMLVEVGAGDGRLMEQMIKGLKEKGIGRDELMCCLVETSPYHRRLQERRLEGAPYPLRWADRLSDLPGGMPAVVVSNELLDAFPVHRIERRKGALREIYVTRRDGRFFETDGPLSTGALEDYVHRFGLRLEEGQQAEVNLDARDWMRELGQWLEKGFVITVDYGGETAEVAGPGRPRGTLRCFSRHRVHGNPYRAPGEEDLTSDVNFEALRAWGEEAGLKPLLYTTQGDWLVRSGILDYLEDHQNPDPFSEVARRNRAVRQLILPGGMGDVFKVLIQWKGEGHPTLRGMNKNEAG
ncbi:SAM-dependent MidA family methyltransferase [Planifilum fimeticola]|uniref:SAM-dependent MidA family methyltransferase n=1 Tax=Planifilum fimeticola TaxID=201975 RepID=A0A2T0LH25_9BACL|nr:SAM-dependent methyltransferase [Planifilum fimeticola]PRX41644.1 SAM-dependent MidA family methyltransferase [Planifilum fimeticola]